MAEIADLTYNVVAFTEIMQMLWKRLNDHGKNWRHVYKALVLLEYLIKTGSEKVAQQCKENIFAIQTLKGNKHEIIFYNIQDQIFIYVICNIIGKLKLCILRKYRSTLACICNCNEQI